jgi:hypothetical protein
MWGLEKIFRLPPPPPKKNKIKSHTFNPGCATIYMRLTSKVWNWEG